MCRSLSLAARSRSSSTSRSDVAGAAAVSGSGSPLGRRRASSQQPGQSKETEAQSWHELEGVSFQLPDDMLGRLLRRCPSEQASSAASSCVWQRPMARGRGLYDVAARSGSTLVEEEDEASTSAESGAEPWERLSIFEDSDGDAFGRDEDEAPASTSLGEETAMQQAVDLEAEPFDEDALPWDELFFIFLRLGSCMHHHTKF